MYSILSDSTSRVTRGSYFAASPQILIALDEPRYLDAARRTVDFLAAKLTAPNGRLLARCRGGVYAQPVEGTAELKALLAQSGCAAK